MKHGDLSSALYEPRTEVDVHMSPDGLNFTCSTCHVEDKHNWAGSRYDTVAKDVIGRGKAGAVRTAATGSPAACASRNAMPKASSIPGHANTCELASAQ